MESASFFFLTKNERQYVGLDKVAYVKPFLSNFAMCQTFVEHMSKFNVLDKMFYVLDEIIGYFVAFFLKFSFVTIEMKFEND